MRALIASNAERSWINIDYQRLEHGGQLLEVAGYARTKDAREI